MAIEVILNDPRRQLTGQELGWKGQGGDGRAPIRKEANR